MTDVFFISRDDCPDASGEPLWGAVRLGLYWVGYGLAFGLATPKKRRHHDRCLLYKSG
ncbi:MAG: hypothetical protein WBA61_01605 [Aequorivita sp.]